MRQIPAAHTTRKSVRCVLDPGWFLFRCFASQRSLPFCSHPSVCTVRPLRLERNGGASVGKSVLLGSRRSMYMSRLPAFSRSYTTFQLQCVANLPHDPGFYTTVDPALSLIPPVAQNSSRWDGGMLDTYILLLLTQIEQILCTLTWTSTFW